MKSEIKVRARFETGWEGDMGMLREESGQPTQGQELGAISSRMYAMEAWAAVEAS